MVARKVETWQPRFRVRGVAVEVTVEPATVLGVADELGLAVEALLSNALRFTDRGDRVELSLGTTDDRATLRVVDTGIGILRHEIPRVFERFFRGSLGRERGLGGSGLGLSLVRDIIETHGGTIRVESVPGEGSCFTLLLPLAGSEHMAAAFDGS